MNCRCGKDDHEVEDDDEDIGQIVIGKLFDRPARTEKEELEYCHGNSLEIVNEETGKAENVKFDWVPPNVEKTLASRYMELLPPDKRPIAGSEAAKARRRQLEQQVPLYDMDAAQRSDSLPPEELQNFLAYLDRIKTEVAGQGTVQEIAGMPTPSYAKPLQWQSVPEMDPIGTPLGNLDANGNIGYYSDVQPEGDLHGKGSIDLANIRNNNVGVDSTTQTVGSDPITGEPRRGSNLMPSLRQQFLGGMVGEQRGITPFGKADSAQSVSYGGTRMTSRPLYTLGEEKGPEGISAELSDLSLQENVPGKQPVVSGLPPPGNYRTDSTQIPYSGAPKGYRPVRPAHLQHQGNQTGLPTNLQHQGNQTDLPAEESSQPMQLWQDRSEYQPGQPVSASGQPSSRSKEIGFHPGQPGSQPDQLGYHSAPKTTTSSQTTDPSDQLEPPPPPISSPLAQFNYEHDRQQSLGYLPPMPGYEQGYQSEQPRQSEYRPGLTDQSVFSPPDVQTDDQEFPPPPPPELLAFPSDLASSDAGSIDSGVEVYDNIGSKLKARLDEEGIKTPLQQMLARERNISSIEATQAPYGAQIDTLAGGMSIAPGSNVNVLFPKESQIIGPPSKSTGASGHKSKYSCQGCNLPMNVGDVAIFCERAGSDKCWHPACFSCFTCKELLADLIYFYKDGKVFCGRHFTESEEMPRCKACDELIFGNSWTRADGFDWHINHFCCNVCDTPMAGQRYVPDDKGYPYCLPCFMSCLAKVCEGCEEKISPEINRCGHRGYFYHATPQCFKCYSCKEPLLGKRFKMSKNWLFCSNECIQAAAEDLAVNPNPKTKEV
ncbi:uncharacterized protein [Palaemon carinicauda]|uniref:uncharacterized protein n=1 Tax=Palaemon carinicauda TaxID=392227 RepID=UPI0035B57D12